MVWRAEVFLILAAGIFCAGSVLVWRGTGGGFGGPDVKLAKVFEANFSVGAHRRHGARYLSQYGVARNVCQPGGARLLAIATDGLELTGKLFRRLMICKMVSTSGYADENDTHTLRQLT